MIIIDGPNLETQTWTVQTGPSVNSVQPTAFFVQQPVKSGPLEEYIVGPAYAGALATTIRPVPIVGGQPLPYLELSLQAMLTQEALQYMRNLEMDVKVAWPGAASAAIVNTANNSLQWALYENGMFQISGSNPWTDTGFQPGLPKVGQWLPLVFRYGINWTAQTFGPVSLSALGQTATSFPTAFQNMPFQSSNWKANGSSGGVNGGVAAIQLQLDNNTAASAFEVSFQAIQLRWSDQPF